jgi:hypothetical protein
VTVDGYVALSDTCRHRPGCPCSHAPIPNQIASRSSSNAAISRAGRSSIASGTHLVECSARRRVAVELEAASYGSPRPPRAEPTSPDRLTGPNGPEETSTNPSGGAEQEHRLDRPRLNRTCLRPSKEPHPLSVNMERSASGLLMRGSATIGSRSHMQKGSRPCPVCRIEESPIWGWTSTRTRFRLGSSPPKTTCPRLSGSSTTRRRCGVSWPASTSPAGYRRAMRRAQPAMSCTGCWSRWDCAARLSPRR